MFDEIIFISNDKAKIKIKSKNNANNLMNLYVIFEESNRRIVGEVESIDGEIANINFLGEIIESEFINGLVMKPKLDSIVRLITNDELKYIVGESGNKTLYLGKSPLYNNCNIYTDINDLFSNHMAIFGNTGSGKSCGVARLLQNIFSSKEVLPFKSNFFIFDAYGEYHNAFSKLNENNTNYNFKYYTTNLNDKEGQILRLPIWLFGVDEMALLLKATTHSQLIIIERMLKLASIFSESDEMAKKYKNHIIAKAIMTILYTNQTASAKRNDIFSILADCSTEKFNLNSVVQGVGYTRKFRECFTIDKNGDFPESILVTEYISSYIDDSLEQYEPSNANYYTLNDLEKALEFTLISEGLLRNEKIYSDAITLKVRLHSITISQIASYFTYPNYITLENYISSLVTSNNGVKSQIINFNLEEIDDSTAKIITKIYTKLLFDFTKKLKVRASIPFHIFLEEAHRYVQNDNDNYLIGYNIFERVAKEGRKYGLIFNLISQRPVEISDTVISQCTNFLIFKMNHPRDLEYIEKMLPNISKDILEKQKILQPGACVAFGKAFKVPLIIKMDLPNPLPESGNSDVLKNWQI